MNHERLVQLMQAQRDAMAANPEARTIRESIQSILHALDVGEITQAQALRFLRAQAHLADAPAYAALYRRAAVNILQM